MHTETSGGVFIRIFLFLLFFLVSCFPGIFIIVPVCRKPNLRLPSPNKETNRKCELMNMHERYIFWYCRTSAVEPQPFFTFFNE